MYISNPPLFLIKIFCDTIDQHDQRSIGLTILVFAKLHNPAIVAAQHTDAEYAAKHFFATASSKRSNVLC